MIPGGWELIVIVLVVVLLFGSKKLPELARSIGKAGKAFKDETQGMRGEDKDTTAQQSAPVQANTQLPAAPPAPQPAAPTAQAGHQPAAPRPDTVS